MSIDKWCVPDRISPNEHLPFQAVLFACRREVHGRILGALLPILKQVGKWTPLQPLGAGAREYAFGCPEATSLELRGFSSFLYNGVNPDLCTIVAQGQLTVEPSGQLYIRVSPRAPLLESRDWTLAHAVGAMKAWGFQVEEESLAVERANLARTIQHQERLLEDTTRDQQERGRYLDSLRAELLKLDAP